MAVFTSKLNQFLQGALQVGAEDCEWCEGARQLCMVAAQLPQSKWQSRAGSGRVAAPARGIASLVASCSNIVHGTLVFTGIVNGRCKLCEISCSPSTRGFPFALVFLGDFELVCWNNKRGRRGTIDQRNEEPADLHAQSVGAILQRSEGIQSE